jgi:hypothetical protein
LQVGPPALPARAEKVYAQKYCGIGFPRPARNVIYLVVLRGRWRERHLARYARREMFVDMILDVVANLGARAGIDRVGPRRRTA